MSSLGDRRRRASGFPWTDELEDQLRRGREEGKSYGLLGIELGCGKNAAVGKGHRLTGVSIGAPRPDRTGPREMRPESRDEKFCTGCGYTKPIREFSRRGDGTARVRSKCKRCASARTEANYTKSKALSAAGLLPAGARRLKGDVPESKRAAAIKADRAQSDTLLQALIEHLPVSQPEPPPPPMPPRPKRPPLRLDGSNNSWDGVRDCQWILEEGSLTRPWVFCGQETTMMQRAFRGCVRSSYCKDHQHRVYVTPPKK